MSVHCQTRAFESLADAQMAYGKEGGRLAGLAANPVRRTPGCSVFLMCDADSARAFVAVVGEDENDVAAEAGRLGGEPFEIPAEHVEKMAERRRILRESGSTLAGFVYQEPAVLRPDGHMERWK